MASVTAVAAISANQPKVIVGANVTRIFSVLCTATASSGDTWIMDWARIPHGAHVFDVKISGKTMDGIATVKPYIKVGSTNFPMGSLTLSVAGRVAPAVYTQSSAGEAAYLPFTVSVSDDATTRFATMGFTVDATSASQSTSASFSFIVSYTMDK